MNKSEEVSSSLQDCLERILEIEETNKVVRVTDLANMLEISKASVNQTVLRLKEQSLVRHETYGPVSLTDAGREIAAKVKGKHVKLRQFLVEVLKVNSQTAEQDACKMEHWISSETINKLTEFLCSNGYVKDPCEECQLNDDCVLDKKNK